MHKGTDYAAPTGTPIRATSDGRITRASRYGSFGNLVTIKHSGGFETKYAHLSRFASGISRGDRVRQGEVIGYVGLPAERRALTCITNFWSMVSIKTQGQFWTNCLKPNQSTPTKWPCFRNKPKNFSINSMNSANCGRLTININMRLYPDA